MAENEAQDAGNGDVVLMVCIECGKEYEVEDDRIDGLVCEKCGGVVFRRFQDTADPADVESDFRERTERDLDTDDPEGAAAPGDLYDLNNP